MQPYSSPPARARASQILLQAVQLQEGELAALSSWSIYRWLLGMIGQIPKPLEAASTYPL